MNLQSSYLYRFRVDLNSSVASFLPIDGGVVEDVDVQEDKVDFWSIENIWIKVFLGVVFVFVAGGAEFTSRRKKK